MTRMNDLLKRAGIDPIAADKRPTNVILGDEIPYKKWAREKAEGKPYRPQRTLPE